MDSVYTKKENIARPSRECEILRCLKNGSTISPIALPNGKVSQISAAGWSRSGINEAKYEPAKTTPTVAGEYSGWVEESR